MCHANIDVTLSRCRYSTFSYSALKVSQSTVSSTDAMNRSSAVTVTVTVANNGEYVGTDSDEVVQVYATPRLTTSATANMSVPLKMLVGFTR